MSEKWFNFPEEFYKEVICNFLNLFTKITKPIFKGEFSKTYPVISCMKAFKILNQSRKITDELKKIVSDCEEYLDCFKIQRIFKNLGYEIQPDFYFTLNQVFGQKEVIL